MVAARALWIVDEDERLAVCTNTPDGPTQHTDTVVVVAGEHAGRADYGISFAQAAHAPNGVLPDPLRGRRPHRGAAAQPGDSGMLAFCARHSQLTTREKAETVQFTAAGKGWSKVIVVTC